MGDGGKVHSMPRSGEQASMFQATPPEIKELNSPELVIGMCGPIGSPIHEVAGRIKEALEDDYKYTVQIVRLSDFIREQVDDTTRSKLVQLPENSSDDFKEKKELIAAGNNLREKYGNSVLADLAIHKIATSRLEGEETSPRRQCFIIDSLKNNEELKQLRSTYGEIFYFIGCFAPFEKRANDLSKKMSHAELHQLIDQDSGEEIDYGQTVRSVFPESDYFVRIDSKTDASIETKVKRLLDVLFHTKMVTPTQHETAMYHAASAAGNSACLSRQVGAAIADRNGEIISIGWNDVPRAGGSVYRTMDYSQSEEDDFRCWNLDGGQCFNDKEKDVLADFIVSQLVKGGVLQETRAMDAYGVVRTSEKLGHLLEFSRSIHAEMHAILSAGHTNGEKLKDGVLYATTYPCHSCARHIVAAGIKDVYFIEPYRKSLATKLHYDAITESETDTSKVRVLIYEGVAPRRYLSLFRVPAGKDRKQKDGKMVKTHPKDAEPVISTTLESIPILESLTVAKLREQHLVE
jgi:deoxycytidylate deaminase